ncbi:3229_t:CDS:2, partial [Racocetra fulgida]
KQEDKQQLSIINNNFFMEIIPKQEIKKKKTKKKQKQTTSTTISVQQFYFYLEESKRIFKIFKRGINLSRLKQMIKSVELISSLGFTIPTCLQKLYSTLIQVYNSLLNRKLSQRLEKKLAKYIETCKQLQLKPQNININFQIFGTTFEQKLAHIFNSITQLQNQTSSNSTALETFYHLGLLFENHGYNFIYAIKDITPYILECMYHSDFFDILLLEAKHLQDQTWLNFVNLDECEDFNQEFETKEG